MISIGGVIGAGLFVGSSTVIASVGPAVVISYLIAGAIVFLVMQMLGELAASRIGVPSFTEYTRAPLGDCVAFVCGWLYAYFWLIVVAVETIAGSLIVQQVLHAPAWAISLVLLSVLTCTNILSVRLYGEFEFWFASIKVAAILVFLLLGVSYLVGLWPRVESAAASSTLQSLAAFMPGGLLSVLGGVPAVIFSICGAEIAAIAAAESTEPARNIARIARSVILRVVFFYVGSVLLIVAIVPQARIVPGHSPFVTTLQHEHVPAAALIMNAVILTAVLSCLNSGLYVASRIIHGLAARGDAPALFLSLSRRRTPVAAVLVSAVVAYGCTMLSMLSWQALFSFLLNASGALMLLIYIGIAVAQIRNRSIMVNHDAALPVRMWWYPWSSIATIAAMTAVLVTMAFLHDMHSQFIASAFATAFVLVVYWLRRVHRARSLPAQAPGA
jgi:AAT family amino acid transporter/GABA permease